MSDYRDIERELRAWTLAKAPDVVGSGVATPADLDQRLVYVRWMRIGGGDDGVTDRPLVDCDVFAVSRDQALGIAEWIRTHLQPGTRLSPGGAIIDSVRANPGPRGLPWDNPNIRRIGATYSLSLRR